MTEIKVETFGEALKVLDIEEYSERIFNSNSRGELFHLIDYIDLANAFQAGDPETFKPWFEQVVKSAEEQWERPESVFQHIIKILEQ